MSLTESHQPSWLIIQRWTCTNCTKDISEEYWHWDKKKSRYLCKDCHLDNLKEENTKLKIQNLKFYSQVQAQNDEIQRLQKALEELKLRKTSAIN